MSPAKVARGALLALALGAIAAAGGATGAVVEVNNLVLKADGDFQPKLLPRRSYAPIEFQGWADLAARDGSQPPALRQALIDFDRDGRLNVAGLPTCVPESIVNASSEEARGICRGALVGTGHIEVSVQAPGQAAQRLRSPLTIFNGPRLGALPTAVLHARIGAETHAIAVPIEQRRGYFRYRVRLDVPPLAGGFGVITHIDVAIGRRYRAGGKARSYVSARCGDNILRTHGRFSFEDGTVIDGSVEKYCRFK